MRPIKPYKVKINGNSLQVFRRKEYIGSISLNKLCQIIKKGEGKSTP